MRIPATRERVRIDGQPGVFVVVWVDTERQTADLIPVGDGEVEDGVSFARIRPLHVDSQIEGPSGMVA